MLVHEYEGCVNVFFSIFFIGAIFIILHVVI